MILYTEPNSANQIQRSWTEATNWILLCPVECRPRSHLKQPIRCILASSLVSGLLVLQQDGFSNATSHVEIRESRLAKCPSVRGVLSFPSFIEEGGIRKVCCSACRPRGQPCIPLALTALDQFDTDQSPTRPRKRKNARNRRISPFVGLGRREGDFLHAAMDGQAGGWEQRVRACLCYKRHVQVTHRLGIKGKASNDLHTSSSPSPASDPRRAVRCASPALVIGASPQNVRLVDASELLAPPSLDASQRRLHQNSSTHHSRKAPLATPPPSNTSQRRASFIPPPSSLGPASPTTVITTCILEDLDSAARVASAQLLRPFTPGIFAFVPPSFASTPDLDL